MANRPIQARDAHRPSAWPGKARWDHESRPEGRLSWLSGRLAMDPARRRMAPTTAYLAVRSTPSGSWAATTPPTEVAKS